MDLYCVKCGEPVENDYLHDYAEESGSDYGTVYRKFVKSGCPALGMSCGDGEASEFASMVYGLAGDDPDFAASMFDDAAYL